MTIAQYLLHRLQAWGLTYEQITSPKTDMQWSRRDSLICELAKEGKDYWVIGEILNVPKDYIYKLMGGRHG